MFCRSFHHRGSNSRPRNGGESAILCKNTLHMELQLTSPCVGELVVRIEWKQLAELKLKFLMECGMGRRFISDVYHVPAIADCQGQICTATGHLRT